MDIREATGAMTGDIVDFMIILWAAHKAVSALHPNNAEGDNYLALSKKCCCLITKWANNCMVTFEAMEKNYHGNIGLLDKGDKKTQWLVYAKFVTNWK
ncbi:hypothetical protein VTH82DRAFT_2334 [Thermothelomyces myriococcoides]